MPSRKQLSILPATLAGVLMFGLAGCKEEPPPPPPATPPPPPAPVYPDPIDVAGVLTVKKPDARLQFPQSVSVEDRSLVEAVVDFANAFTTGDDAAVSEFVDGGSKQALDQLIVTGGWYEATDTIEAVRIVSLSQSPSRNSSANSGTLVFAVQNESGAIVLGWDASKGPDGGWLFTGIPTSGTVRSRAAEWDGLPDDMYYTTEDEASSMDELEADDGEGSAEGEGDDDD